MVTHEARAAAIADRILFLADGLIVKELPRSQPHDVLAAMESITARDEVRPQGLLGRKLRTALTAIAIVLGVAMVSGTFVLTDSIDKAFDTIFTDVRQGSNAVISGKSAFDLSEGQGSFAPTLDESLLSEVRELGRRRAEGSVDEGPTDRRGRQGDRLRRRAQPRLLDRERRLGLQPAGARPGRLAGGEKVVVDESTADREDLQLDQRIGVQAEGPVQQLRISGIVRFGSVSTIGGATLAGFDLQTAQELFGKRGKLDEIAVASEPGTSDQQLIQEIEPILPSTAQVKSASQQERAATPRRRTSSSASSAASCWPSAGSRSSSAAS